MFFSLSTPGKRQSASSLLEWRDAHLVGLRVFRLFVVVVVLLGRPAGIPEIGADHGARRAVNSAAGVSQLGATDRTIRSSCRPAMSRTSRLSHARSRRSSATRKRALPASTRTGLSFVAPEPELAIRVRARETWSLISRTVNRFVGFLRVLHLAVIGAWAIRDTSLRTTR